jgi:hypothetical protein
VTRQLALWRGAPLHLLLALGYLGLGLALAHLIFAVTTGQLPSVGVAGLLVVFVFVLAAVRASSQASRPRLLHLLLAPLPLVALFLAVAAVRAAFVGPPGPPAALVVATNLVSLAAVLAAHRLYKTGFYSHRWVGR